MHLIGKGSAVQQVNAGPGGFQSGMLPIVFDAPMDDVKAEQLYFVHIPDASKPRKAGVLAVTNVNFGS